MKNSLLYIRFAWQFAWQNCTLAHIKYFFRWKKDMQSGEDTLIRELPWMTYDAIDFLSSVCTSDMKVFEWGSGGSTLFFARHTRHVISVEHSHQWAKQLSDKLKEKEVENVTYQEISGETIPDWAKRDYRDPDDFISKDKDSSGLSFEKYVKAIEDYPVDYFDIVVVDGRARNCCIKYALSHVKKGGYLIVDNSDRKYYVNPFPELENPVLWEKKVFQGPVFFQHAFGKTSFFKKRF